MLIRKFIDDKKDQRILDIGTGNGRFIEQLKQALLNYSEIVGIDSNEKLISDAKSTFSKDGRIRFETMPFEQLAMQDEYFDLVTMSNVLHHMQDPRAVLREIRRVLKEDGVLFVIELFCDNQNDKQQTHVLQHHFRAKIDTALGMFHGYTYPRSDIMRLLVENDFNIDSSVDFNDSSRMSSNIKADLTTVAGGIEKYISLSNSLPQADLYRTEGQQILERIYSIGFELPTQLIVKARKRF
jgi:ubiquinone/menaquinone biosynthesis C-methylase UbiE